MQSFFIRTLLFTLMSFFIMSVADANWRCTMVNKKGQNWVGVGPDRVTALLNVRKICANNSQNANNCQNTGCVSQ